MKRNKMKGKRIGEKREEKEEKIKKFLKIKAE